MTDKIKTAKELWDQVERPQAVRAEMMPTEHGALRHMHAAYQRLRDLGWREGIYAPKDGTVFQVIENGSTGIFDCAYSGEWPDGFWNTMDASDVYPSRSTPVLFRLKPKT